jgi:uncharacterized SAM-binding protein YcdF (DUF218 family)
MLKLRLTPGSLNPSSRTAMLFFLSKTLGFFTVPSNVLSALGLIGVLLLCSSQYARVGRWLLCINVVLLAVIGFLPIGAALTLPLEERFPAWIPTRDTPTGIIVLGAAAPAERIVAVAEFAIQYPKTRILVAGGNGSLLVDARPESAFIGRLLESFGIPAGRIELESRSRSTVENAVLSKEIAAPVPGDRWLLVTSAMHMPRAVGAFRQAGFCVEAYPTDLENLGRQDELWVSGSLASGLAKVDAAAHEWVGLMFYRLTGQIAELFPGPKSRSNPCRLHRAINAFSADHVALRATSTTR